MPVSAPSSSTSHTLSCSESTYDDQHVLPCAGPHILLLTLQMDSAQGSTSEQIITAYTFPMGIIHYGLVLTEWSGLHTCNFTRTELLKATFQSSDWKK
ncbi:hypothetical protein MHYP_G00320010 [Metynnis hypsauchen]